MPLALPTVTQEHYLFTVDKFIGVNITDEQSKIPDNMLALAQNRWQEHRGVWVNRLGMVKWNATPIPGAERITGCGTFYTLSGIKKVIVITKEGTAAKIYSADIGPNPVFTQVTGPTALSHSEEWFVVQWLDKLYIGNGIEPIQQSVDGVTRVDLPVGLGGVMVKGKYATIWKDRLVVAGNVADPSLVAFSNALDPTVFQAANQIYVRKNDGTVITNLGLAGVTTNVQAPTAELMIHKERSTHVFSGELYSGYTQLVEIDGKIGCVGSKSFCYTPIGPVWWGNDGIYTSIGTGAPQRLDADIKGLFIEGSKFALKINLSAMKNIACVYHTGSGHVKCSYPVLGSVFNTHQVWLDLRDNTRFTWSGPHTGQSLAGYLELKDGTLLGMSATNGQVYQLDTGVTDDGSPIQDLIVSKFYDMGLLHTEKRFMGWKFEFEVYKSCSVNVEFVIEDRFNYFKSQSFTVPGDVFGVALFGSSRFSSEKQVIQYHRGRLPHDFIGHNMYFKISGSNSSGANEFLGITLQYRPKRRFIY